MTLKDVARVSGCSVATVSKVFKNSAEISEDTKRRVIKAARQIGYLKKATSKPATLGGQRPIIFCDTSLKYSENLSSLNRLCEKYDFSLIYVVGTSAKAKDLALQIGAWGVIFAENAFTELENSFVFSGDQTELEQYLKALSKFVPKRAPRTGVKAKSSSAEEKEAEKPKEQNIRKQEDIWLL